MIVELRFSEKKKNYHAHSQRKNILNEKVLRWTGVGLIQGTERRKM